MSSYMSILQRNYSFVKIYWIRLSTIKTQQIIWLSSSEEQHHHATINNPHVQTLDGYMPLMHGTLEH